MMQKYKQRRSLAQSEPRHGIKFDQYLMKKSLLNLTRKRLQQSYQHQPRSWPIRKRFSKHNLFSYFLNRLGTSYFQLLVISSPPSTKISSFDEKILKVLAYRLATENIQMLNDSFQELLHYGICACMSAFATSLEILELLCIQEFIQYFEDKWFVGKFPLIMWNVYWSDFFRTNNHLEGWHNHLK